MIRSILILFLNLIYLLSFSLQSKELDKCEWKNPKGLPCLIITKTPNTSSFDEKNIKSPLMMM